MRVVPVPWLVNWSGYLISVHVPGEGNPDSTTLPVATWKVGWVIVPTTGALGIGGWAFITALPETGEVHCSALVTAKLYTPAGSDEIVALEPVPVRVAPPG